MRKSFFYCFSISLTIVGSIIGAGFITGKEIYEFFCKDFSATGLFLTFVCFTLFTYFIMRVKISSETWRVIGVVISICNIVVTGCMISVLNDICSRVFYFTENIEIFTILSTIFVFIISLKGVEFVIRANLVLMPITIISVICLSCIKIDNFYTEIIPKSVGGLVKPFVYVGFNLTLSMALIKKSGEKLSPLRKFLSSVIVSAVLCSLIFIIGKTIIYCEDFDNLPFRNLFINNRKHLIIIDIITLFAVFTTMFSSVFSSIDFGGVKLKLHYKILIILVSCFLSKLGFSTIVERLYPILGIVGYLIILFIYLSQVLFLKGRRERTYHPLKGRG